jgi:hypothetical protein
MVVKLCFSYRVQYKLIRTNELQCINWGEFVLNGSATWRDTSRDEHALRVFENRVLRKIFGPKRDRVKESGGNYITKSFMTRIPYQIFRKSNEEGDWRSMLHVRGRGEEDSCIHGRGGET